MEPAVIGELAEAAEARYGSFLQSLRGILSEIMAGPYLDKPRGRDQFASEVSQLLSQRTSDEIDALTATTEKVVLYAVSDVLMQLNESLDSNSIANSVREQFQGDLNEFFVAYSAQMTRDADSLKSWLRHYGIEVARLVRAGKHSRSSANVAVRNHTESRIRFTFTDRLGRRFDSTNYIQRLVRAHFLNSYNETIFSVLAERGITIATVRHQNELHPYHGNQFIFAGEAQDGLPLLEDYAKVVFHPNSEAVAAYKLSY